MNKLLLLCLLVLAPVSLASADLKVAVIDLGRAFDNYYKTKDAQARLKEKEEAAQKDLSDLTTEYEHMQEEGQKLFDASKDTTLSQAARQDKGAALQQKQQDLLALQNKIQETKQERERDMQDDAFRRRKEILDEITKVVSDYSIPKGFDIVFDKSGASAASGLPVVLYSSPNLVDITDDIIKQLNATAPPPSAAPTGLAPATSTTLPPAAPLTH
jgi:outer membrane protein